MALRSLFTAKPSENHSQVVQVVVGAQHALLLTDEGIVYSWGSKDEHGQLGRKYSDEVKMREPSPITDLRTETIVQIACGLRHCLALSQHGALFAWGYNKAGQLGIDGFTATMKSEELDVKRPTPVKGFTGQDPQLRARSCSCGPESSACVTTKGEVFVWGAVSYYLFGQGSKYGAAENCTVPVKVRGVPSEACQTEGFVPDRISLHKEKFACTISQNNIEDDLMSLIASLKARSSQLIAVTRQRKAGGKDAGAGDGGAGFEREELRHLEDEFQQQKQACDQKLRVLQEEQVAHRAELHNANRQIIICDQTDSALGESVSRLEVRRHEPNPSGNASAQQRVLETQINDINHFKSSNRASRLQLLANRDKLEHELMRLTEEHSVVTQQRQQLESRAKLIHALQRGDFGNKNSSSMDDALNIASNKRQELAATGPAVLAGAGKFTGFREVLAISDRALQDVSSALKEVSAAASGGEGAILEEVLQSNLKLRKECNAFIQEKLQRAEKINFDALRADKAAAMERMERRLSIK